MEEEEENNRKSEMNIDSSVDDDNFVEDNKGDCCDNDGDCIMPDSNLKLNQESNQQQVGCTQQLPQHQRQHENESIVESYEILEQIGRGAYGIVHRGTGKITGRPVAMKHIFINQHKSDGGLPVNVIREIATLRELNHPNIVQLLDLNHTQPMSFCLVFEYVAQDLKHFIDQNQTGVGLAERHGLNPHVIKKFMKQIFAGVAFCHCHRILHRDLKPGNLLISADGETVKIADFGLARLCGLSSCNHTPEVVTLWYRAPELILRVEEYFCPVDIWSVGCIFAELISGFPLFPGRSDIDQLFRIYQKRGTPNDSIWPGYSSLEHYNDQFPQWQQRHISEVLNLKMFGSEKNNAADLLERLLQFEPTRRLACSEALNHEFLN